MKTDVTVTDRLATTGTADLTQFGRQPLRQSALAKLRLGAVLPDGWLARQLHLERAGMVGHLDEISGFVAAGNGWLDPTAPGWEEGPYWLRTLVKLGALTGDPQLKETADRWCNRVLESQQADGYFGPHGLKDLLGADGSTVTDLWPHMLLVQALLDYQELTEQSAITESLLRFFRFCSELSDRRFVPPSAEGFLGWGGAAFGSSRPFLQHLRAGDMIPHLHRLYNLTGERFLLRLATRFFERIRPPWDEWLDHHAVNFPERFAYGALYWPQSGDAAHLESAEYWYRQHMMTWGQMPGGIFAADERIRPGCTDPRFGFETCGMVEFARSFELLGTLTGDPRYPDRTEEVLLNHYPAAYTADMRAVHYITAANQPILAATGMQLHRNNQRKRASFVGYTPKNRCCGHNGGLGWPLFVEHMWRRSHDGGLVAWLYGPSRASMPVGPDGVHVSVHEVTEYPFSGHIEFHISVGRPIAFPLYLRVPAWVKGYALAVNGEPVQCEPKPGQMVRIIREFRSGDTIRVTMDMETEVIRWPVHGGASVRRGPLWYSLRIGEKWSEHPDLGNGAYTSVPEWPNLEVEPTTPWNYALVVNGVGASEAGARRTGIGVHREGESGQIPWASDSPPVVLSATGRKVPQWQLQNECFVGALQQSPVRVDTPEEDIELVPLGCARLRISVFPVASSGPSSVEWSAQEPTLDPRDLPPNRFDAMYPVPQSDE